MKSLISIFFTIILFGCFGKKPTIDTGHEGKSMPSIKLLLMDSTTHVIINEDHIDQPKVLFYFSPYCPYCRALTKSLIDDANKLNKIKIYMLSSFPLNEIRDFYKEYGLINHSNIMVGQDYESFFSQYFKAPGVPCLAIYGKDNKLKDVLIGTVSTNLIKDIALE